MRAITTVAAHRLRASWRAWAALALLIGLAGGVVMTAAAGARRTENAYPQFLRATAAADVLVGPAGSGVGGFDFAIAKLPGVSQIAPVVGLNCVPLLPTARSTRRRRWRRRWMAALAVSYSGPRCWRAGRRCRAGQARSWWIRSPPGCWACTSAACCGWPP